MVAVFFFEVGLDGDYTGGGSIRFVFISICVHATWLCQCSKSYHHHRTQTHERVSTDV